MDTIQAKGRKSLKTDSDGTQGQIKKAADNQQPRTKTSLYIPTPMLKQLKYKAIEQGTNVNDILMDLIREYLER